MRILRALDDVLFRPSTTTISLEIGNKHRAVGVCVNFSAYAPTNAFACVYWTGGYTSLNRENAQQKYRNRVSERSFSPLSAGFSVIIAQ